jgi:hypothetical protein
MSAFIRPRTRSCALSVPHPSAICASSGTTRTRSSLRRIFSRISEYALGTMLGGAPALRLERVFENRGSAIPMSAVTFSPRYSISLRLPCDASRAQRGRNPALLRVHLHPAGPPASPRPRTQVRAP